MRQSKTYIAIPSSETIREQLTERQIHFEDFTECMGLSKDKAEGLLNGDTELTHALAMCLEKMLGIPSAFWEALEDHFRKVLRLLAKEEKTEKLLN